MSTSACASSPSQGDALRDTLGQQNAASPEVEDLLCALVAQALMITEARNEGLLGKLGSDSDAQLAIDLVLQETEELEQSLRLAKSLCNCESLPEQLLEEFDLQDSLERNDHELALRISQGESLPSRAPSRASRSSSISSQAESSAAATLRAKNTRLQLVRQYFNTMVECSACYTEKACYNPPCSHAYCLECAQSIFRRALGDRSLIPVRCCSQPLPSDIAAACFVDAADLSKYRAFQQDIENPSPPAVVLDTAMADVIARNHYQVCPRCGAVVDRTSGCVHITCSICRYEFCYTCLKKWRTCRCELYPAVELEQILNERIEEGDAGYEIHRLRNVLRNHGENHRWASYRSTGQVCNVCRWTMPLFYYRCGDCREIRCRLCARNR